MTRYCSDDYIERILQELETDEEELLDDPNDNDIDYEPQYTEIDDHDSGSEVDMEDDGLQNGETAGSDSEDFRFYIGKDGETLWASKSVATISKTKSVNIIKTLPGPKGQARQCKTQLECFSQIITHNMIDDIVKCTNIFIQNKRVQREVVAKTEFRARDYRPTSRAEISALFGALFLLAIKRGNRADMSEFFNKNGTGLTILRANFSENRFRLLLRSLRFDDINTRSRRIANDKLAPIREFFTKFVVNCQRAYNLGEFSTIDEMLVACRGRCSFIQYMSKKPATYGLKMYALCDAQTFYTYNLEVYCGIQKPGPYVCSNKPFDVVTRLIDPIKKTNRNLTTDNYFSSFPLAEHLLAIGITFIGTLKTNKKEIPPEFVVTGKDKAPGHHMFGCQEDKSLISLVTKKKKIVLVLSTLHHTDTVDEDTKKPVHVMDYNATKGGVDTVDLMCSRISTSRRTQRWPMTVFFRLLDIAGINSMRIFQMNNPFDNSVRRKYLYELAMALMAENLKERANLKSLPKDVTVFLEPYRERLPVGLAIQPTEDGQPNQRAICYMCGSKKNHRTQLSCKECGKYICKNHCSITCKTCVENEAEFSEMD